MIVLTYLKAAWAWLKKNWQWLLFPVGVLLYVIGRASAKTNITVVSPGLTAHEEVEAKLDAEATRQKAEVDAKTTTQLAGIEADRAAKEASAAQLQVAEAKAAQGDPDKINDLLKAAGRDIRR